MKHLIWILLFSTSLISNAQNFKKDSAQLKLISNHILDNYICYTDLEYLCKQIGHRLSGTPQAEQAVYWAKSVLEKIGCDRVYLQEVMVPHWVRGEEEGHAIINGKKVPFVVSSLGNSVGTGTSGIQAEVIKINHIDELKRMNKGDVEGKIVFYNFKFDQTNINTFESYGPCVYYRWGAPSEAAKMGAIGVVIRSVSSAFDNKPHTGSISYDKRYPSIPSIAISNLEADILETSMERNKKVQFYIRNTCQMLDDVKSYNVIGELKGTEHPDEIIAFGGHLDSWDIGEGAHDDGAGVVQAMEILRVFKQLGIRPKRTLRAVLFMNEENGMRGAVKYAETAVTLNEKHILGIESDAGGATPWGFGMRMPKEKRDKVASWNKLFLPYGVHSFTHEGGGPDMNQLFRKSKTPVMELLPDSQRYFDYHHSDNDVFENVHRRELCLGAIAMAHMVYLVNIYGL